MEVNAITKNTMVPLSVLACLIGGIMWITMVYAQVKQNTKELEKIGEKSDSYLETLHSIDIRLGAIETELKIKMRDSRGQFNEQ